MVILCVTENAEKKLRFSQHTEPFIPLQMSVLYKPKPSDYRGNPFPFIFPAWKAKGVGNLFLFILYLQETQKTVILHCFSSKTQPENIYELPQNHFPKATQLC